jgi:hypothetical protein
LAGLAGYAVAPRRPSGPMQLPLPPGLVELTTAPPRHASTATVPGAGPAQDTSTPGQSSTPAPSATGQPSAPPTSSPSPNATATGVAPSPTPTDTPSPSPSPVPTLSAELTIQGTGPLGAAGYSGQLVIRNSGVAPASTWTLVLSLPDNETVVGANRAYYVQDGEYVTFTPASTTAPVPPNQSVTFTFDVDALLGEPPNGCAIDGHQC